VEQAKDFHKGGGTLKKRHEGKSQEGAREANPKSPGSGREERRGGELSFCLNEVDSSIQDGHRLQGKKGIFVSVCKRKQKGYLKLPERGKRKKA